MHKRHALSNIRIPLLFLMIAGTFLTGCDSQKEASSVNAAAGELSGDSEQLAACGTPATLISKIQGEADLSPHVGETHQIEAVVTAVAPLLSGYFVQEEQSDFDQSDSSSEGLFVYSTDMQSDIAVGQLVRVIGDVQEIDGKTQLAAIQPAIVCEEMQVSPLASTIPQLNQSLEAKEHMLLAFEQPLIVINTYNLSRFGQIDVSTQKLFNPSHVYPPGSEQAAELAKLNALSRITLDDLSEQAPDSFARFGALDSESSIRIGSNLSSVIGVLDQESGRYRIRTTEAAALTTASRPSAPDVEGDIVIAAFNVLNLFNGDGQGGEFPTQRGAKSIAEYERQQTKIVNAILKLNPDIIGLNEIENDGENGETSAIYQLATALNEQLGREVYDYLAYDSAINGASIANGILFRTDKVSTMGETKVLTSENSPVDDNGPLFFTEKSRPAITQAFKVNDTNNTFAVSVNHLKSKGSGCGEGDDSPEQGNCNLTRTRAAQGLAQWLDGEYADLPVFIIGDLNSYPMEDPISALQAAGFTDVIRARMGSETYTYSFRGQLGTLDYVMANDTASGLITSAYEWHINAAEPRVLDYRSTLPNSEDAKPTDWLSDNAFRSSDHDPVVVGISF